MTERTLVEAVNLALANAMAADEAVVVFGEDVAVNGGVFRATAGLLERFGAERVLDTPLAEALISGIAVGMAAQGLRPVAEIQFAGFAYSCIDQMLNHAARMRYRTRGRLRCPMVLRTICGGGIHAPEHHSESPEAMFGHIPGLRVVMPSTPARAYGLLLAAIRDPDPVVFLEPTRLYRLFRQQVEDDGAALPLDCCFVEQEGDDLTMISWGSTMVEVREAAQQLDEEGISATVIDLATIKPFDVDTVLEAVAHTGRCLIAHEAPLSGGWAAEVAATVAEGAMEYLLAPIRRVTGYDTPMPLAQLEQHYLPSTQRIVRAAHGLMEYS
ncbi:MAG: alpha-ketoacid dehydrogenase subunit beta [Algiphilus sp.]